ncbi:sensor protein [Halorubrum aidingense JCM 13560]|uniref:Sensor protein n=1 Tax=Halorubrum aidingense JCM 13560 TaxID=1230454 RepID=M0PPE7_9EURY|nr:DICT sensory domain-containing protein [Halorubrum aidingense]EMA70755.1 sensor protein [Halorubrum aidingense JCM 13560]
MTLASLIDEHRARKHQIVVYSSGARPEIETWLADHGVAVESRSLPVGGPDPFLEIKTDGEMVGIIGANAVEALLEPPIRRPGDRSEVSEGYRVLFEILERTVFFGMNRRDLLAVSREIEDRAFRVGEGTLWVSFQTLSTFRSQTEVYRTLGAETDLEIHIFGVEDWTPPPISGITYHAEAAARFEPYWVLAYDGGTDEAQACALVAEEHANGYTGFWTNDSATVENIATTFKAVR